ncbi:hypothetical protein MFIFM68171_05305 [Madurella fahalii]|uniref:Peptidase A1 domain-containing protein n=1 Tax=Madurella fahalii TaxID=1157608 RepID=A0ABQ0GBG6_9PEZI
MVSVESAVEAQSELRSVLGLSKVWAIPNDKYQRHGTKSYVSALNRYGFQPTRPGPYFQTFTRDTARASGRPAPGSLPAVWTGLYKRNKDGSPSHLTAEDQQNDLEYLCEVSIGSSPQQLLLYFDTGSADLWEIRYGDGSTASGIVGIDIVSIGGLEIKKQTVQVALNSSLQFLQSSAGVLGLAFRQLNTVRQRGKPDPQRPLFDNMIHHHILPKDAQLFTCALYSNKAEMFPSEYAIVNGKMIPSCGNKAVADTGTSITLVSDEVCNVLYGQINGAFYSYDDQAFIIPISTKPDQLPNFSIAVGDNHFAVQKHDLLFAPASDGYWYGGVQSRGKCTFDILGATFLKSIYAIWDQGNSRFGAVPKIEKSENIDPPPAPPSNDREGIANLGH